MSERERVAVAVVGAGQAGLAVSHELTRAGVGHVVLERARVGETWRGRWDSFCLVTPNWAIRLPGCGYEGSDPDGFMPRDEIVAYLERYAASFEAPVREGVDVTAVQRLRHGGFALAGHFLGMSDGKLVFADDLTETVAWGDERYSEFTGLLRKTAAERGLDPPDVEEPEPFDARGPEEIDLDGLGAVVFAGGFRPDYRSWLPWPEAFDELGFPIQQDGASTVIPGLYFVGVHFLRKRKSSLLLGVGEDASIVAEHVAGSLERG